MRNEFPYVQYGLATAALTLAIIAADKIVHGHIDPVPIVIVASNAGLGLLWEWARG